MEHLHRACVFTSGSLWNNGQSDGISGHQTNMENCRGVVLGVLAIEWVSDDRFAQIAFGISLTNSFVDSILQ